MEVCGSSLEMAFGNQTLNVAREGLGNLYNSLLNKSKQKATLFFAATD